MNGKDLGRVDRKEKQDSNIVHEKFLIKMNKYNKSFGLNNFWILV